jgi:acetyltransferase-like isoleucine patch superfamily enzyme
MRYIIFYIKFFLKGGYCNNLGKLNFAPTSWIGKSVSIFFENPGGDAQTIELGHEVKIGHFSDLAVGYNNAIRIRDFTTLNTHCKIAGDVTIERYCLLSSNILISSGAHYATSNPYLLIRHQDYNALSSKEGRLQHSKPVHIEEDVWIGFGVFIKQGITIGRGAVVGANSVVLNDIPPYEIHAGSPARKLKNRLDFKPKNILSGTSEEDRPYFYRGFKHPLNGTETNPKGLLSFERSSIAIPFLKNEIVLCKGFLMGTEPIWVNIKIDNIDAGKFKLEETFELRIQITTDQFLKRETNKYSFVNFEAPEMGNPGFGIERIAIIDSV